MNCPKCKKKTNELQRFYTQAGDILLVCPKCKYTKTAPDEERKESISRAMENHIRERFM